MKKPPRLLKVIPARLDQKKIRPDLAIQRLKEGNQRFANHQSSKHQLLNPYEFEELIHQSVVPFGIVLTCSDSHIPVEAIFDTEPGTLFIYRVTGHTISDLLLAGIEHALSYYDISVLVVLGHSDCQAIEMCYQYSNKTLRQALTPGQQKLMNSILENNPHPSHLEELRWSNIRNSLTKLKQESTLISTHIKKGKLKLIGAAFHPASGTVQFSAPRFKGIKKKAA